MAASVRLSSTAELIGAIQHARAVSLGAYVLFPDGAIVDALADAAQRGVPVSVRSGTLFDDRGGALGAKHDAALRRLTASGAEVTQCADLQHLKAAVVDGVAYLDDRNWSGSQETVLRDDRPADVRAIRAALESGEAPPASRDFAAGKRGALRLESDVIARTRAEPLDVESETISRHSPVYKRLLKAAGHARVRLIVARREARQPVERKALNQLVKAGVEVHTGAQKYAGEKFCVTGSRFWVGSANATGSIGTHQPLDWGLSSRSRAVAGSLHEHFETAWANSEAYAGRAPAVRSSGLAGSAVVG